MNLASAHQRHRTEAVKYQEQLKNIQEDLATVKRQNKQLEQEVYKRDDQLSRSQTDLKMTREDLTSKTDEVCFGSPSVILCFYWEFDWDVSINLQSHCSE